MGCYLEDYRARIGIWAGRLSKRGVSRLGETNGTTGDCLELTVLNFGGFSCVTDDWWKWEESWCCCGSGEHRATLVYWVRQESEVGNSM
jgi:hypothetical protein